MTSFDEEVDYVSEALQAYKTAKFYFQNFIPSYSRKKAGALEAFEKLAKAYEAIFAAFIQLANEPVPKNPFLVKKKFLELYPDMKKYVEMYEEIKSYLKANIRAKEEGSRKFTIIIESDKGVKEISLKELRKLADSLDTIITILKSKMRQQGYSSL